MFLNELKRGERAVIVNIQANKALRDRFSSFGIVRGEELVVKEYSIAKKTMEILVGYTSIALRAIEAEKIEIDKLNS
jgi:ferrous iron transport protein A